MTPLAQLAAWESNPSDYEDEGVEAPTQKAIKTAREIVKLYEPLSMVRDPNGGIVLEFADEWVNVWEDGGVKRRRR